MNPSPHIRDTTMRTHYDTRPSTSYARSLPPAWYIALSSRRLKPGKVLALELFGEKLVAWRTKSGRPVIMPRYCPHQGASLAIGKVIDDELRCPFHHWRFDGAGVCTAIPGAKRIPPTARVSPYPVVERYGYVWVWYGTAAPLYDVPDFPPLTTEKNDYVGFRYRDRTTGTVRHLLENAVDYYHFLTLHGLAMKNIQYKVLKDQNESSSNGLPIECSDAWFGVKVSGELKKGKLFSEPMKWISEFMSTFGQGGKFEILVDGIEYFKVFGYREVMVCVVLRGCRQGQQCYNEYY